MNNNKYRILIIEDDRNVSSMLCTMLDAQNYETLAAHTCAQGSMMLSSHVPDLVLLDLGLPDRDGVEFIRSARHCVSAGRGCSAAAWKGLCCRIL